VATYAKADGIHVRITAAAEGEAAAEALLAPVEARAHEILGTAVYAADDETLGSHLAHLLEQRGLTLAAAETTSAGALAMALVSAGDTPAYRALFRGALVLGESPAARTTAEDEATDLARHARHVLGSDLGLGLCGEVDERGLVVRAVVAVDDGRQPQLSSAGMSVAVGDAGPRLVLQAFLALWRHLH
jgi:nicotinamide-nucleotide amidase